VKRREFLSLLTAAAIPDRMSDLHVPGVSIAWMRSGKVDRTEHYGVKNPETVFQAASISKPVAAMAALHMSQYGNFTLDENVNGKLTSWQVPENEFTKEEKVTVRRLLSHTAGMTVHGFPGYKQGAPFPSLLQVLNGQSPANTPPIRVDTVPGTKWRYSGGGYTVLQQLMIDRMKTPYAELLWQIILKPLDLDRSLAEQPLPFPWVGNAARAHDAQGQPIAGKWHSYPELAAAGLWTTPTDLCKFAIELRKAVRGESAKVLQKETARLMVTREKDEYALGFAVRGEGKALRFAHNGANAGYRCMLEMHLESGDGLSVMTNSDNGGKLIDEIRAQAQREFGWK